MQSVNFLAVLGATTVAALAGAVWFSLLLFVKIWLRECGMDGETFGKRNPWVLFGVALLLNFVTALVFALCVGSHPGVAPSTEAGLVAGIFWVGTSIALNHLFEGKSLVFFCITGGYHILRFTLIGLVIGLWG